MLNIDDEVKTAFLRDSSAKELVIDSLKVGDYMNHSKLVPDTGSSWATFQGNYYGHDDYLLPGASIYITVLNQSSQSRYRNILDPDIADSTNLLDFKYLCVTASIQISNNYQLPGEPDPTVFEITLGQGNFGFDTLITKTINFTDFSKSIAFMPPEFQQISFIVPTNMLDLSNGLTLRMGIPLNGVKFAGTLWGNYLGIYVSDYQKVLPFKYKQWSSSDYDSHDYIGEIHITNDNLVSESFSLNESLCSEHNIKFGLCEAAYCQFTVADNEQDFKDRTITPKIMIKSIPDKEIPLGVFKVNSVKKHHVWDMVKQEITAYDNLTVLEQNAADWYTQYMFGIETDDYVNSFGFEYARQIFSTYYNYAKSVELENSSYYTDEVIYHHTYTMSDIDSSVSSVKMTWEGETISGQYIHGGYINYIEIPVNDPDPTKLYKVSGDIIPLSFLKVNSIPRSYYDKVDKLARGLCTCNILIHETLTEGENKFCVDLDDYFMISPDCTSFKIYIAARYFWNNDTFTYLIRTEESTTGTIIVYKSESAPDLPNGHTRLLYYNYKTKDIFACESSITGRNVVHSLLEVNGCFFRLSREDGKPQFIYCTKSGLYPRNDLYPADDLYPREGASDTISMGKYRSFVQEDYTVQKYGKIQIRKNIVSNETKSIVEWEYTGDDSYDNVYAIDDNIFYCNEKMEYDYDNMPEVSEMLANMWNRISNMDYVPCTLVCMGMPWIECGDRIGVLTKTGGAESFIFHRTLKGIQALTDTFESEGDEYTEAINDYGYKEWEGN